MIHDDLQKLNEIILATCERCIILREVQGLWYLCIAQLQIRYTKHIALGLPDVVVLSFATTSFCKASQDWDLIIPIEFIAFALFFLVCSPTIPYAA